jgi:beta-galactosidase/beta-glucuronidase
LVSQTFCFTQKHTRKKIFIEFEGVRQAGEVYLNGQYVGIHENGIMAFGFDISPWIKYDSENVIAVRTNNAWDYREKSTNSRYQWSDKNFNANYGGLSKNVWLHITDKLYQTLPLYSFYKLLEPMFMLKTSTSKVKRLQW